MDPGQGKVISSEFNTNRELQPPHRGSVLRRDDAGDLSGIAVLTVHATVRLAKVYMVEDVERFGPELYREALFDGEALGHSKVRVHQSRAKERVAINGSKGASRRTNIGTETVREETTRRIRAAEFIRGP